VKSGLGGGIGVVCRNPVHVLGSGGVAYTVRIPG
jgi:hypothetical protein